MYICPNCKTQLEDDAAFCYMCGTIFEQQPAPQPVQQPVYNEAPVAYEAPKAEPGIARAIIALVLCAFACVFSVTSISEVVNNLDSFFGWGYGIGYSFVMGLVFAIPMAIVGLKLGGNYAKDGGTKKGFIVAAKILGIIGIVLSGVAILVSLAPVMGIAGAASAMY